MKILMLVNWKVEVCDKPNSNKLAADYVVPGEPYWFFRYFPVPVEVDVVDIRTLPAIEKLEKEKLRFYVTQFFKVWGNYKKYDLILSHGMQSGIVLSLYRRLFGKKCPPHVVFDIGAFNSARETGRATQFMQFASRSLDGIIYHASSQKAFYEKCYPWLKEKAVFLPFGADTELFARWAKGVNSGERQPKNFAADGGSNESGGTGAMPDTPYVLFVGAGYQERDNDTLLAAWENTKAAACGVQLRMIGSCDRKLDGDKIKLLPKMPIAELNRQIAGAQFCILPLTDRNFSYGQMTLLQQMAFGKAVITARARGVQDYVKENETALFYEPGDADSLAAQIDRLLTDMSLCSRIGEAAKKSVYEYYNEQRMAQDIYQALEQLCWRK